MWGPDFQTADGAFTRIAELERWRQANAKPEEMVAEARKTADQAHLAAGILIHNAFSGREYRAAAREMEAGH